jgi:hypothetical protein
VCLSENTVFVHVCEHTAESETTGWPSIEVKRSLKKGVRVCVCVCVCVRERERERQRERGRERKTEGQRVSDLQFSANSNFL